MSWQHVRGSVLTGAALFSLFEIGRLALNWPMPCDAMLEAARADARVVSALGGAPVRLAHPFWSGDVGEARARVTLPLRGEGTARATLDGEAERVPGAKKERWRLTAARVRVDGPAGEEFDLITHARVTAPASAPARPLR